MGGAATVSPVAAATVAPPVVKPAEKAVDRMGDKDRTAVVEKKPPPPLIPFVKYAEPGP